MKNQIYILIGVLLIILDIYSLFNYEKLLKRQFKAFHLGDNDIDAKKSLELRQKITFVGSIFAAIFFLLKGFGII